MPKRGHIGAALLLIIGLAGGVLLQPLVASVGHETSKEPSKPQKDKKLVSVDPGIAIALGIEIATAGPSRLVTEVRAVGMVGFNEPKLAHLAARVSGSVRQVLKSVGDTASPVKSLPYSIAKRSRKPKRPTSQPRKSCRSRR